MLYFMFTAVFNKWTNLKVFSQKNNQKISITWMNQDHPHPTDSEHVLHMAVIVILKVAQQMGYLLLRDMVQSVHRCFGYCTRYFVSILDVI